MFWWEHVNKRKHVSEHSWLCGWVILSILAHLAHLAQSYISLINSATNTCKCSWFDLTSKKICSDWKQNLGEKWPILTTFFLTATAAITGKNGRDAGCNWDDWIEKDLIGKTNPRFRTFFWSAIAAFIVLHVSWVKNLIITIELRICSLISRPNPNLLIS